MRFDWKRSLQNRLAWKASLRRNTRRKGQRNQPLSTERLEERSLLSAISVIASDSFASEGESTGTFVFSRDGDISQSLDLTYAVGGSASAGVDFDALAGSLTIPVGSASASVIVNPLEDSSSEGSESVTVTLSTVAGHTLDLDSATVTIRDAFDGAGVGALVPLSETFTLHSLPDARHTIYLDFDGGQVNNPDWQSGTINVDPFTNDGSDAFSDEELAIIQRSWEIIAEDFAPFAVNVTTAEPGIEKLRKTGASDTEWGLRVMIGDPIEYNTNAPGRAIVGSFNEDYDLVAWTDTADSGFTQINEFSVSGITSHEIGHAIGLDHDGGSPGGEYYDGHGSGETRWTTIMGNIWPGNVVQWSDGSYPSATNTEDDLAIITTQNGFGYRPDDHADSAAAATPLTTFTASGISRAEGLIETSSDFDLFSFVATGGDTRINIRPTSLSPNLDIKAELYDGSMTLLATSDVTDQLAASFDQTLSSGTHYVRVTGTGNRTWNTGGYDDYGSLGQYAVEIGGFATVASFVPSAGQNSTPITGTSQFDDITLSNLTQTGVGGGTNGSATWPLHWDGDASQDLGEYISFTATPDSGRVLDLDELTINWGYVGSSATVAVRSSVDGFAANIGGARSLSGGGATTFDLSSVADSSAAVEFRVYLWTGGADWRDLDSLSLSGRTIADGPVPPTAPVANNDAANTGIDDAATINVLANDTDANGDALTVSSVVSQPTDGSVVINVNNTITYTPNTGFEGVDSFTYIATDGGLNSNAATVTIDVSDTLPPPPPGVTPQYTVNHHPRLQLGDAPLDGYAGSDLDQIAILWQTQSAGSGTQDSFTVEYRLANSGDAWQLSGAIAQINTASGTRIVHEVEIDDLNWDTEYEYRVRHLRAGGLVEEWTDTFETRLQAGDTSDFTFVAYGDSAKIGSNSGFRSVQNRINQTNAEFAVLLGDNIYEDGTHGESDARFDPDLNPEAAEWMASHIDYLGLGNHDVRTGNGSPSENNFAVPVPTAGVDSPVAPPASERPEHNFSWDYGDVHFVTFDTNAWNDASRRDALLDYVIADLDASDARWKIVYGHHPIAAAPDKVSEWDSSTGHDYYDDVVSRFTTAGVDLFLTGHSHTFSWTHPLTGRDASGEIEHDHGDHDQFDTDVGLVQIISGLGGKNVRSGSHATEMYVAAGWTSSEEFVDGVVNPTSQRGEDGFAKIDVTQDTLTISYVAADDGAVIGSFTITQEEDTTGPTADLHSPADNGANDLDPTAGTILVNQTQPTIDIHLHDTTDINDTTVTASTVSLTRDGNALTAGSDYSFSYDAAANEITLTSLGGDFGDGVYNITLSGGAATIADTLGNVMTSQTVGFEIDTSITPPVTVSFQDGVSGYDSTIDTYVTGDSTGSSFGNATTLLVDDGSGDEQMLIRFEDLFGGGAGQIPIGATIQSATLEVVNSNPGGNPNMHRMLTAWSGTSTWNSLGSGVRTNGVQATATTDGSLPGNSGTVSVDVTASLQAWAADPSSNLGWAFLPTSSDGVDTHSSEASTIANRPKLTVTYVGGGVNVAPIANNDTAGVNAGDSVTIPVLSNDTDANGDAITVSSIATQPTNGSVVINANNTITYTPNAGYVGADSFNYVATDGSLNSNTATVDIVVGTATDNVISVIASDPMATEAESTGTFVFARTGDVSLPVTVNYSISGLATSGIDYDALSGSVTIAAGDASASVVINPLDDDTSDGTETVTMSVSQTAAYDVDLDTATLNIRDQFDGAGVDALFPLSETFTLNSLPDARHTIYLDFFGGDYYSTIPTGTPDPVAPFDHDGNISVLSDQELASIQEIWIRAAEDFLPFNVNVTTQDPGIEALRNTGNGDLEWGVSVLVGTRASGGFAQSGGGFDRADNFPGYVSDGSPGGTATTAAGIAHEVGHALDLDHDGVPGDSYYNGHDAGVGTWMTIMGTSVSGLSQWDRGSYANANNQQDDLAIITNSTNGFGYRPDDHTDNSATATTLVALDDGLDTLHGEGIIGQNTDFDLFTFEFDGGTAVINVDPAELSPNLDVGAELYDSSMTLVATGDQIDNLSASFIETLAAGTYFLRVTGTGNRTWSDGYDDYGSLGAYTITIGPGELAYFNPTGGQSATTPVGGTSQFAEVTVGDLTGVNVGNYGHTDAFPLYWDAGLDVDPNEYISFSVTAGAGDQFDFDELHASFVTYSSTTSDVALRSSIDGFTANIGGIQQLSEGYSEDVVTFDVNSLPQTGGTVEFRLYVFDSIDASPALRDLTSTAWSSNGQGLILTGRVLDSTPPPANNAPVAVNDAATTNEDTAVTIAVQSNDSDPDGDPLTTSVVTQPTNGSVAVNVDGTITYTPDNDYNGSDSFTYRVNDGSLNSNSATVSLTVIAAASPTLTLNDTDYAPGEVIIATFGNGTGNATDWIGIYGNGDTPGSVNSTAWYYTNGTRTASGSLTDGSVTLDAGAGAGNLADGTYFAAFFEDDSYTELAPRVTFTVTTANVAPVAVNDSATVNEDESVIIAVLTNDSDPDGNAIAPSIVTNPANGSVTVNTNGTISYTPDDDFNGTDSFTYRVSDGSLNSNTATVSLSVAAVNDAPVAANDGGYDATPGVALSVSAGAGVLANDTDIDGDTLTASLVTGPANGSLTLNADGSFVYTPNSGFLGTDTFTYAANDGTVNSNTATVSINVSLDPVTLTFQQDENGYTGTADTFVSGDYPTFSYGNWNTLEIDESSSGDHENTLLRFDDIIGNATGQITRDSVIQTATLEVYISDYGDDPTLHRMLQSWTENSTFSSLGAGIQANGIEALATADATLDVTGSGAWHTVDVTTSLQAWANDPSSNFGWAFLPGGTNGVEFYSSESGWPAPKLNVSFLPAAPNTAPVAADDSVSTNEDTSATISILTNDSDAEGHSLTPTLLTQPANGTATLNTNGTVTYTPDDYFNGSDSFTYQVNDGELNSNTATVNISVAAVNDAPTAVDDFFSTDFETLLNIAPASVLDNDSDIDGDPLSVSSHTQPANGSVTVNADGSFTYSPETDFVGDDTFTYTLSDGTATSTATVSVTVDAPPDDHGEATDATATAITLSGGDTGTGAASGTFEITGDRDMFRVTVGDGELSIDLDGINGLDTYLRVYDSSGTEIASNDDGGPGLSSALTISVAPGTYYISAGSFADSERGDFDISVSHIGDDHADVAGTSATPISLTGSDRGTGSASGTFEAAGDRDVFSVAVAEGELTVDLNGINGLDTYLRVYDAAGTQIASNDDGGPGLSSALAIDVSAGTFYISAGSYNDASAGDFTLDVSHRGLATSTFQQGISGYNSSSDTFLSGDYPNQDFGGWTVNEIDLSSSGDHEHSLLQFGDLFGSGTGQIPFGSEITSATLTFYMSNGGDQITLHRMLSSWTDDATWNSFGNGIQANGIEAMSTADAQSSSYLSTGWRNFDVTTSLAAWAADPTSNHGWALLPTDSNGVDFYSTNNNSYWVPRISIDYLAPAGDLHADTPDASATILDLSNSSAGVSGTFESAGDRDVFQFTVTQSTTVTIDLGWTGAGSFVDTYLRLYDDAGNWVGSNDDGGSGTSSYNSRLTLTLSVGTYFVSAGSYADSDAGDFRLDLTTGL